MSAPSDRQLDALEVVPPSLADKQRAGVLMATAREMAVAQRKAGGYTAFERAARQVVLMEEAARRTPQAYTHAEVVGVLAGFHDLETRLAAAGAD